MRFVLLFLILTACGHSGPEDTPRSPIVQKCQISCFKEVVSEGLIDCAILDKNAALARKIIVERGLIPNSEVCEITKGIVLYVRKYGAWNAGGIRVGGWYGWPSTIETCRSSNAIAHEILHLWDSIHFAVATGEHGDWETNGYYGADKEYVARHLAGVPIDPTGPWHPDEEHRALQP